jgi:hypothetical protein
VNRAQLENEFQIGLEQLLGQIDRELAPDAPDPYQGVGKQVLHEHDTRVFFFDRFLKLLGWQLGLGGDVAEEARIKAETTTRMDYVGVNDTTNVPVLVVEAKSWEKPFVGPRDGKRPQATERELIVEAIRHIRGGGTKETSPVTGEWHENLQQVSGYVRGLKEQYGHELPCAMLASGRWLLVFTSPVAAFVDGQVNDEQFKIFKLSSYVESARDIYNLLGQPQLARTTPIFIRSAQLPDYVPAASIAASYHALLIRYERSGATAFTPIPRILVYPALLIQRDIGTLFTVIDRRQPIMMALEKEGEDAEPNLTAHLRVIALHAAELLQACSRELDVALVPSDLTAFPGFATRAGVDTGDAALPLGQPGKKVVRPFAKMGDEWVLATGTLSHYLLAEPTVACRFHSWAECHAGHHQIGPSAISTPSTDEPRAFFVDRNAFHCAHQQVQDRRAQRCHIAPMDTRTCCRACTYQTLCWSDEERRRLPCGG